MKRTVVTVTGIRPDFIRMWAVFRELDQRFNHILIHTGQHFDDDLSGVFFSELNIREPDINLGIGGPGKPHWAQTADLSKSLVQALNNIKPRPDLVVYLGDSNSVTSAIPVKKEGYRVCHIEAGMRSYDRRMLEEINRVTCDSISDLLFCYHEDYRSILERENNLGQIHVVGNTIVEPCMEFSRDIVVEPPCMDHILLDIHRPENFQCRHRLKNILTFANWVGEELMLPVHMLSFGRTIRAISEYDLPLGNVTLAPLRGYRRFLADQYHSYAIISDSGTAQEEPALLGTPVLVPRDYTERPQSIFANCSKMVRVEEEIRDQWEECLEYVCSVNQGETKMDCDWLGNANTSQLIAKHIEEVLSGV